MSRLDKHSRAVQAFAMVNRPPSRLLARFCVSLACYVAGLVAAITPNEVLCAPTVKTDLLTYRYPQDDLGATYSAQATTLKLWAPTASQVVVDLFASASASASTPTPMTRDGEGIWSVTLAGNLDGKYYLYRITLPGLRGGPANVVQVNDPYARGCSANTGRTLIYDPAKTNPDGWEQDKFVPLKNNTDAILYEVHVRDFSINSNSGSSHRGKYLGMVEAGTKSAEGAKTGIDHLAELGITHVHLLPVNDFAGGDERQMADQYTWYNWGYDPVLYSTPEGSYASNPDGTARQVEFKRMVQAFHQRHIGVVADVVFNHTATTGLKPFSIFDKIFPQYYYRTDASGHYANATGCGNEVASERPMARKLIVDCIKYWMREYHVDGFRFDLMGILDRETMLEVYREARMINPNAIIYGEGWDMEKVLPPNLMMTQANVRGTGVAAFNDGIRDNIKGDAKGSARGFVQGAEPPHGGLERFWLNIKGQNSGKGAGGISVASPDESINYASAHDDLCLWDKLLTSTKDVPENLRINMDKLAAGIVLTSQGVPFLHAGDEFLRSKNLNSNSYNNNEPGVNPIDWGLKTTHQDVFEFYRGLIALRKAHPAFRMTEKAAVDQALELVNNTPENMVVYLIKNHANGDSWNNILVVFNGSEQSHDLKIPGNWKVVANEQRAGVEPLQTAKDEIHVEPHSLVIAYGL